MNKVDTQNKGGIDFQEFLALMDNTFKTHTDEEMIMEAFKVFDIENTGSISAENMRKVMARLGENLTMEEIELMISQVDQSGTGT